MKYINRLLIIGIVCFLCGCADIEGDISSETAVSAPVQKPVMVIDEKEKKPAMVINEKTASNEALALDEENIPEDAAEIVAEPGVIQIDTRDKESVVIDFAGDICFDDGYSNMNRFRANGSMISGVLSANILAELNSADITMVNNEFPYTAAGEPLSGKTFTFKAKPDTVKNLQDMGVDIVSLANNHAYDQGAGGLLDTLDTLKGAGIEYVGAGTNISEASAPVYYRGAKMKIAFVSATQVERTDTPDTKEATDTMPGVLRTLDPTRFLKVIEEASANADITIVYVHWGSENTYDVDASQKALAKQYVQAGADLIIGDHSHCLQGFEYVEGVPVVYSLGNFWFNSKDIDTCIVQARAAGGKIEEVRFLPCRQMDCTTRMYEKGDSEYMRIMGAMESLSFGISLDEDGYLIPGEGLGVPRMEPRPVVKPNYAQPVPDMADISTENIVGVQ